MPTLQPTRSDMWVRSTNTSTAAFQLWADWFDTVSTHWEVVDAFGVNGGDGFTLRQLAGGTTTKYLLQRSSDNLNILIDPSGSVSLQDGLNASAFSSPLKFVFSCGTSAFQNEW